MTLLLVLLVTVLCKQLALIPALTKKWKRSPLQPSVSSTVKPHWPFFDKFQWSAKLLFYLWTCDLAENGAHTSVQSRQGQDAWQTESKGLSHGQALRHHLTSHFHQRQQQPGRVFHIAANFWVKLYIHFHQLQNLWKTFNKFLFISFLLQQYPDFGGKIKLGVSQKLAVLLYTLRMYGTVI